VPATKGNVGISAAVVVNKSGPSKVRLTFTQTLIGKMGGGYRCDVSASDVAGDLRLMVEFAKGGAFEAKPFGLKRGAFLFVPLLEEIPEKATPALACEILQMEDRQLIFRLPVEGWAIAAPKPPRASPTSAAAHVKAPAHPPAPAAPPPAAKHDPDGKLDVVEYLSGKGVKISRIAGNRISVDGEVMPFDRVLSMVNRKRVAAELPILTADQAY
jgi:hypothetical protein